MKKFIQKLVGFSLGPLLSAFISFITIPVTTFFILPEEYGKASMFTMVQALIVTLMYLGMDQSYTREYHYVDNKKKLFQNSIILPFFVSILLFFIIAIFRNEFSKILFNSSEYSYLAVLFSIMIVLSVFERFILLSIRMEERALEFSFFSIFLKLMIFIFTLFFILIGNRTFKTVVYSTILGQFTGDIILMIRYRKLLQFNRNLIDKELIKNMFVFGLPLIIAASVNNILNTSGRYFLRAYSTYHELGIYTAAINIAGLIQIIQLAFTSFWIPTAYRWNKENREMKNFSFVSDALLLLLTLGFFFILFFKKYIVLILSSDYSEAQFITGLVALTPILYTLSETTTLGIVFSGKSYFNIWVSILSLIPNIILNIFLVPRIGTVGAAISTAVAYIIFCFCRTYFSRKVGFQINFWKQLICILLFFVAACLNAMNNQYVFLGTILIFCIVLIVQIDTFRKIIDIYKSPENWDFE